MNDIETVSCNYAHEFLDKLLPHSRLNRNDAPMKDLFTERPSVYRGQKNTEWELIPRVWRSQELKNSTEMDVIKIEYALLRDFLWYCETVGLNIPNDSPLFRMNLEDGKNPGCECTWPSADVTWFMALAQHHGVPTRLIDWTSDPYYAAFFAAMDVVKDPYHLTQREKRLVVWKYIPLDIDKSVERPILQTLQAPGWITPNLAAQRGLFTFSKSWGSLNQPFVCTRLHDALLKERHIKKYTLPWGEAPGLIKTLNELYGINSARLFPSYDGAAKATLDKRLYETSVSFGEETDILRNTYAAAIACKVNAYFSGGIMNDAALKLLTRSIDEDIRKYSDEVPRYASDNALAVAKTLSPAANLFELTWRASRKRQDVKTALAYEHAVCVSDIRRMCLATRGDIAAISSVLKTNVFVVWVTAEENKSVSKMRARPNPHMTYRKAGISAWNERGELLVLPEHINRI